MTTTDSRGYPGLADNGSKPAGFLISSNLRENHKKLNDEDDEDGEAFVTDIS